MEDDKDLGGVYQRLKSSPYWREDFRIEEAKDVNGMVVYFIKADDSEPATVLAIAQLNEVLQR
ncbi:hypothetical protein [Ectopseudomonas khazarica]|uniref:hypothetical protein n=1 Tax=Ectopseudomonas khazarica TaxID=2502979 RepID=UPI0037C82751